jgi:recombination protein RecA
MSKPVISSKGSYFVPDYYLPTPSLLLNEHLVGGGIPAGSLMQIMSKGEGTSKTSVALQMIRKAQEMGLTCAYIDAEAAMDTSNEQDKGLWLESFGIDMSQLWFVWPNPGEVIWTETHRLIEKEKVQFVVMDSIHAVRPSVQYEKEMGSASIGNHAKLHQDGILKALPLLRAHQGILCGINHKRVNMTQQGAMGHNASGGRSWAFYSKFNFEFSRSTSKSSIGDKDLIPLDIYIEKSKGGKSYVTVNTHIRQGKGIDWASELLNLAIEKNVIEKSGSWYRLQGEPIGQGTEKAAAWCEENKDTVISLL